MPSNLTHVSFPSIENFHNIVKSTEMFLAIEPPLVWPYRGYVGSLERGTVKYRGLLRTMIIG